MGHASDRHCPDCGSRALAVDTDKEGALCLSCDWAGALEDAALDTSTPYDVRTDDDYVRVHVGRWRRLTPNKAEALAEALTHAAADARGHRDPGWNFGDDE